MDFEILKGEWNLQTAKIILIISQLDIDVKCSFFQKIQTGGDAIPFRSAFKNVIFRRSWNLSIERPLGVQNKLDKEGKY